jgi:hypothetical protein
MFVGAGQHAKYMFGSQGGCFLMFVFHQLLRTSSRNPTSYNQAIVVFPSY